MSGINHQKQVVYYCYTHIIDDLWWFIFLKMVMSKFATRNHHRVTKFKLTSESRWALPPSPGAPPAQPASFPVHRPPPQGAWRKATLPPGLAYLPWRGCEGGWSNEEFKHLKFWFSGNLKKNGNSFGLPEFHMGLHGHLRGEIREYRGAVEGCLVDITTVWDFIPEVGIWGLQDCDLMST